MLRDHDRGPATPAEFWTVVVFVALIFIGAMFEIFTNYHPGKSVVLFFFLFWMPLVAVHELGHAWMARLLNWDVFAIVVGVGKVVRYFRVGKLTVELRIIPIEGFAQIAPRNGRFGGWRGALIYFAGPGIELLIFFVLMAIFGWSELITLSDSFAMTIVQGLAVAALVGAVLNLIPHGTYTGNGWIANDGLGILQCLFALNRKQRIRKSPFDEE